MSAEPEIIDMDEVRALAFALGPLLDGKNIGVIQAALVQSWLQTTGLLNEYSDMDERLVRGNVFVQLATREMGRAMERVRRMSRGEIEMHVQIMEGPGPGGKAH